jgi:hypothetical protein
MYKNEFPKEFYLELTNNDNLLARVVINKSNKDFHYEIDIVFKESRKIFRHIGREYGLDDERDALDQAVIKASRFLNSLKN